MPCTLLHTKGVVSTHTKHLDSLYGTAGHNSGLSCQIDDVLMSKDDWESFVFPLVVKKSYELCIHIHILCCCADSQMYYQPLPLPSSLFSFCLFFCCRCVTFFFWKMLTPALAGGISPFLCILVDMVESLSNSYWCWIALIMLKSYRFKRYRFKIFLETFTQSTLDL